MCKDLRGFDAFEGDVHDYCGRSACSPAPRPRRKARSRKSRIPARSRSATVNPPIPFSYYDDKQQVVGYAMDLCNKIVDAVKANLKLSQARGQAAAGDLRHPHSA